MAEPSRRLHDPAFTQRAQSRASPSSPKATVKKTPLLRQGVTFPAPGKPARARHHRAGSLASSSRVDPSRFPPGASALSSSSPLDPSAQPPATSVFPPRASSLETSTKERVRAEKMVKGKTKIKPLLKKWTASDENAVDLSRSAMEDDGLGIYLASGRAGSRSALDAPAASTIVGRGPSHHRSTSGTSQFSTTTTASAGRQYVHPMRQTPRPFTPPIAHSYTTSLLGSDVSGDATDSALNEDDSSRRVGRDPANRPFPPYSSSHVSTPPLRLDTSHSLTHLTTDSPSNLAGTPSSFRPRADTLSPAGTMSPTSRSSVDMPFTLPRGEAFDSAGRAASIRAAREAFTEREAAKAEKAERERQRQLRKLEKREQEQRAKSGRKQSNARRPSTAEVTNEKDDPRRGMGFPKFGSAHEGEHVAGLAVQGSPSPSRDSHAHTSSTIKTAWIYFITWLKTRLLKIGRKMKLRS